MPELTDEQKLALDKARHMVDNGVPVFRAMPDPNHPLGFRPPTDWQHTKADPAVVDRWRPGDALCAVMGHTVDAVDIDPRNGGSSDLLRSALDGAMPRCYGKQATPSGGFHWLVAALGLRTRDGVLPGVDVKAGDGEGSGHGFVFLAPTERVSKASGELAAYEWIEAPDLTELALIGADNTGAALAELVRSRSRASAYDGPSYDGPAYADLGEGQRRWADAHLAGTVEWWRTRLDEAADWPESERDDKDRGWEVLSRDGAWAVAMLTVCPWTGLDEDAARKLYAKLLPDVIAADPKCQGKWTDGLVANAATKPVEPPPWADFELPPDDGDGRYMVDVTNESDALRWLEQEVGRGRLSGVFRRGQELVHTPRIGEHGYVEPKDDRDSSGPAQVRRIDAQELARRIDHGYTVARTTRRAITACLFPQVVAGRAASAPDLLQTARDLRGVTHTPVVRADGSVLDAPGYDVSSGMLYLPDPALAVPKVSERPSRAEVQEAGKLLLGTVQDFPFVTPHDRANYLGALLTPMLRPLVPPPYKLIAIGAPQRGSGKSLLAWIIRELHGGVFKSEFPRNDEELRKFITSTLDATTGPAVQFDNVTGVLKSSVLDGLLTSAEWADRLLGQTAMLALQNDRLWVVTGNNVHIGGDLERRTLWVTINANMERPEERTEFTNPDLESWVAEHRGELLWTLLTLIRAWVVAGRPMDEPPTSDGFGKWVAVLRGVLKMAELGEAVGVVGHADSVQGRADPDDEEWAVFLAAARRVFGPAPWTARELLDRTVAPGFDSEEMRAEWLFPEELPGNLGERLDGFAPEKGRVAATKSLGKWLGFRDGRWADGLSVQSVATGLSKKHAKTWRVVDTSALG